MSLKKNSQLLVRTLPKCSLQKYCSDFLSFVYTILKYKFSNRKFLIYFKRIYISIYNYIYIYGRLRFLVNIFVWN